MYPARYCNDCGYEGEAHDGGIPPVEYWEQHDSAGEEGEEHHDAIDDVDQTVL